MQMYRVKFARKLQDDMVDMGDVLVCANSQEAAITLVGYHLDLRMTETEMEVSRVKPSIYQISRREVKNSISAIGANTFDAGAASSATFPGVTESLPSEYWHSVAVQANIRAENEEVAVSRLATSVIRNMQGEGPKGFCKDLDIKCDRGDLHVRPSSLEENALYTFRQIFAGGAGRPR
jgi:hypothetical protein